MTNATRIQHASTSADAADSGNASAHDVTAQGQAPSSNTSNATQVPHATSTDVTATDTNTATGTSTTTSISITATTYTSTATTTTNTTTTSITATTSKTSITSSTISKTITVTATTTKTTTTTTTITTKTLNPELNPAAQGLDTASMASTAMLAPVPTNVELRESKLLNTSWLTLPNVSDTVCSVARIAGICPDVGSGRGNKRCAGRPGACCPVSHRNCSSSNPMSLLFGVCPKSMGTQVACVGSNPFSVTNVGVCMCLGVGARCEGTAEKPVCIWRGISSSASSQIQLRPGVDQTQLPPGVVNRTYFQGKNAADVDLLTPVTYNYFGILLWTAAGGLLVVTVRRVLGRLQTRRSEGVALMMHSPVLGVEAVDTHPLIVEF
eukprot:TRINITY_DN18035_c0_g1_i2.p1 TRINITY_DN18035_c0_g1~~TRINITY_DN18035_c0_g1_i2.p1  ORF type:complete len:381 (+),score=33.37 TRINITY_DN18035_c0_g1_i2:184-1326(+)